MRHGPASDPPARGGPATPAAVPVGDGAVADPRRWWTLGVLCLSLLIVFIGNSSLNVALPTFSRELDASTAELQWVVAAYSLTFAGLLFTGGAVGDRFGRKGALQAGLAGFLVAAVAASMAGSMGELIAWRAVMGACAAFIMPSTLSILVNVFPAGERARAIAIWAGVTGSAGALGPVATGWLLDRYPAGSMFLVNVPVLVLALALGAYLVPRSRDPEQARLDPVGAALSVVGISAVVFGLIRAPESGWASPPTLAAFALGAVVIAAFVAWELRHDEPMLDMAYFRDRAFSTASAGMTLVFMSTFGVIFLVAQYFQLVLGFGPFEASVRFLPMAPVVLVIAPMTPRLVARIGAHRTVAAGMGLVCLGFLMFTQLDRSTSYPYVFACVLPIIGGSALTMAPMTAAIMGAVPARRAGAGSAMNDATRELGAALGVAVLGSVAASRFAAGLGSALDPLGAAERVEAGRSLAGALEVAGGLPAAAGARLATEAADAFVSGVHAAALLGAALAALAAAGVYRFMPRDVPASGALHGPVEAMEDAAELGFAGVPPVFADTGEAGPPPGARPGP